MLVKAQENLEKEKKRIMSNPNALENEVLNI